MWIVGVATYRFCGSGTRYNGDWSVLVADICFIL